MLERYTLKPMRELWLRPESKFEHWLKVEVAVLKAMATLGRIPSQAPSLISTHAVIDVALIDELEAEFQHDMIAFVEAVRRSLAGTPAEQYAKWLHYEVTSYDVEDPALVLMLREAVHLIIRELDCLQVELLKKAVAHEYTMMIARTHGQYAHPDTFGRLLLVFLSELNRCRQRLYGLFSTELAEGKLSGAVGNYAEIDPEVERLALEELELQVADAESQILQRDRHAMVVAALTALAGCYEQMAKTFWVMMRSEVGELREGRKKTQRGSSAMPQKRNPIKTEQLMGLPRLLRGHLAAAMEDIATFECREISQSSVERHILPDATSLTHYMTVRMTKLVETLEVRSGRMRANLDATGGIWAAQRVRNALIASGMSNDEAYQLVQAAAFKAEDEGSSFAVVLGNMTVPGVDQTIPWVLGEEQFADLFSPMDYIKRGVDTTFARWKRVD